MTDVEWIFDLHRDMYLDIARGSEMSRAWVDSLLYHLLVNSGIPRWVAAFYWLDARVSGRVLIWQMRRYA